MVASIPERRRKDDVQYTKSGAAHNLAFHVEKTA
jgi:hypothetical protein